MSESQTSDEKRKRRVMRISDALLNGDQPIKVYVPELDANFFATPKRRSMDKRIREQVPKESRPDLSIIDLQAAELEEYITGWEDQEADEHPLRAYPSGALIPYSPENLSTIILEIPEAVGYLIRAVKDLSRTVEEIEEKN